MKETPTTRRAFLGQTAATSTCLAHFAAGNQPAAPIPFRTIYSNDTTHILSCQRPENRSEKFSDDLLRQSIVEAAGVDAHFLQPGLGWIPWWKSEIYPIEDHYNWLRETHGIRGIRKIDRYLLEGGDMLATLIETCRELEVAPFLSFRLNDGHHVRDLAEALERGRPTQNMSRHYWDNYERYRIGPDTSDWDDGVFDWSIPEVRDHKFDLIEEACANYDIAGLELDFLRHWVRFGPGTLPEERFEITQSFVSRIRSMLDRTAKERKLPRRRLCVRVPANASVRPDQGIDLAALSLVGVDMINLSYSYFTWQDDSVKRAREEVGDSAALYTEMTHTTMTGKATAGSGTQPFLRTTDEQFYTTTRLADEQGATGVSLFNFPYYRYHVTDTIGPFHEPPFHVIPRLRDRGFLGTQREWYQVSMGRNDRVLGKRQLPAILKRSHSQTFRLFALSNGKKGVSGILRLRSDESIADREIEARFNGVSLESITPVVQPLPHPYNGTWLGKPQELSCFELPATVPVQEVNEVEILVRKGIRVRLIYFDLIL